MSLAELHWEVDQAESQFISFLLAGLGGPGTLQIIVFYCEQLETLTGYWA